MAGLGDIRKTLDGVEGNAPGELELEPPEILLDLSWGAPDGKSYKGSIRCRIISGDERQTAALSAGALAKGVNWESLPQAARERFWGVSWMGCFLRDKGQPDSDVVDALFKWLPTDDALFDMLWEEVWQHHSRYFRADRGTTGNGTEIPRVSVATRRAPSAPARPARPAGVQPSG